MIQKVHLLDFACGGQNDFWDGYVSNTAVGTGNNFVISFHDTEVHTFRCRIKPLYYGHLTWRFWYQNSVDSTFDDGSVAAAGMPGGCWEIVSASVATDSGGQEAKFLPVTFGESRQKSVCPEESFWSDPCELFIQEGGYLIFSWALRALSPEEKIPMSPDSQIPCFTRNGNQSEEPGMTGFLEDFNAPKPNLFAVKKEGLRRLCFLGDSITQGLHTGVDAYAFWAAKISEEIKHQFACWNVGLGFARAADAASDGPWLNKAKQCETVILCLGVNDLLHGHGTAETVLEDLQTTVKLLLSHDKECQIILFTVPPLNDPDLCYNDWVIINETIRAGSIRGLCGVFDISKVLGCPYPKEYKARFGELHPDGNGGTAVAEFFLKYFSDWQTHLKTLSSAKEAAHDC